VKRLRGLADLVVQATIHGSRAIERIQLEKARVPFEILESVPMTAGPAKLVHVVHDLSVTTTHATIRAVATGVGHVATAVIDSIDRADDAPDEARDAGS
jgi:hypothetical protein